MLIEVLTDRWPAILLSDLLRYLLGAGSVFLLVAWLLRRPSRRYLAPARPSRRQIIRELAYSLGTVLIFSLNGAGIEALRQAGLVDIYLDPARHGLPYLGLSLVALVIAHDAYFYWTHRLLHLPWLYRRAHHIHHRSRHPTPWAAYAFHPAEAAINALFLPLALLVLPLHVGVIILFLTHMILRNALGHSGFEVYPKAAPDRAFWRHLTSTTHHHLHHEWGRGNYGLYFSWWDRLMATEREDYRRRFAGATGSSGKAATQ